MSVGHYTQGHTTNSNGCCTELSKMAQNITVFCEVFNLLVDPKSNPDEKLSPDSEVPTQSMNDEAALNPQFDCGCTVSER